MTTTDDVRLDAYLERIGYRGTLEPTLDTLRALHRLHPQSIAFENLDPLLRRPVVLDTDSLHEKLVRQRRGGYCYEHNLLFSAVLRRIGFKTSGLAARVLWNRPEGTVSPRTHMLLRLELDGEDYLVDVGFGGLTLTAPLRLTADIEQSTPHEDFRLANQSGGYLLQARLLKQWRPLYWFDCQEHLPQDYEIANWYVSTHPASHFVNRLLAGRPAADGRYALLDNTLTIYGLDGTSKTRVLTSAQELRETLERDFAISLADLPACDALLQTLIEKNSSVESAGAN